jgi:hypothetical protein
LTRLASEIKRASRDLDVDSEGRVWYKPTGTPLFRIAERDGTVWLQTLRGHDIGPASDRKDFWEAVNAVANLAFRLEELADAAKVRKKDLVLDRAGNAIAARAGDVEYRYSIEARPGKPWKLSDSIVVAGEERQLNFKAIKPVLKKAAEKKPAKKAVPVEDRAAEPPPPPPPAAEKPSPVVEVEKTEEAGVGKAEPDHEVTEQAVTVEEEPGGAVAVLDGDLGRKLFTAFAELGAPYIYAQPRGDGVVLYAMDPAHVMMAVFHISKVPYSPVGEALGQQTITYEPRYEHVVEDLAKQYTYDAVRLTIKPDKLVIELLKNSRTVKKETMKGVSGGTPIPRLSWRHHFKVEIDGLREVMRHADTISDSVTLVAMEENPLHLYVRTTDYDVYYGYVSQLRISEANIPSKFAVMYYIPYLRRALDIVELFADDEVTVEIAGGKIVRGYDLATVMRVSHSRYGLVVDVLVAPKVVEEEEKFVNRISGELGRISSVPAYESVKRYAEVIEKRSADITVSIQWAKELGSYMRIVDMKHGDVYFYIQKDAIWFTAYGYYTGSKEYLEAALQFGGVKLSGVEEGYIQLGTTDRTVKSMIQMLPKATGTPYLSYYTDSQKLYFSIEDKEGHRHVFELSQFTYIPDYHKRTPEEWLRPRDARTLYRAEVEADRLKSMLSKYRDSTRVVVDGDGGLSLKGLTLRAGASFEDASLPVKPLYVSEDVLQLVGEKSQKYIDVGELREAAARLGRISENLIIEIVETGTSNISQRDRLKLALYAEDPNTGTKAAVYI